MVKRVAFVVALVGLAALVLAERGSGLVGNINAGTLSGTSRVRPGEPVDSVAWLENRTGHTVTLRAASILPLNGFRTPRLVGVAVERRQRTRSVTSGGAWTGWPSRDPPVTRLFGHRIPPRGSRFRNSAFIVFGVAATRPGRYAVAGVNVTVIDNGLPETVQAIGPLAFCVSTRRERVSCPTSFTNRALDATNAFR